MRSNGYWLNTVLLSSQEYPQKLDWARSITEDYKSITVEEINLLAHKFLKEEKALRLLVTPEELEVTANPSLID
jgi:zinc protease